MVAHIDQFLSRPFVARRRRRLSASRLLRVEAPRRVFGDT
jgi:hypothetical protein